MLGIPYIAHAGRTVALDRVRDFEIRMFETLDAGSAQSPLFWIELVDLRDRSSVDSCGCNNLGEAAAAFADFTCQAGCSRASPSVADEMEG